MNPSELTELAAAVASSVREMPRGHVQAFTAAVLGFNDATAEARVAVLAAVANPVYRQRAAGVFELWRRLGCSGPALALALSSCVEVRERERHAEEIEVVATGPASPHVSLRQTKAVLLELVARSQRELIAVSYAAYQIPELIGALEEAIGRRVAVRLILETSADSDGALTLDGSHAFAALQQSVELYAWRQEQRPAGARLHAKVVVVDGEWAFITSANLTGRALDQNLEVGALVRGGAVPQRLAEHFRALMARGTLSRIR